MRRTFIAVTILVALLLVYVLLPTGAPASVYSSQHVDNEHVTKIEDRRTGDKSAKADTSSAAARASRRSMYGARDAASAMVRLARPEQFTALAEMAKAHGVAARWNPALRRMSLHGKDEAVRRLLSEKEFAELGVEYNVVLRMIPENETEHIIGASGRPFVGKALEWLGVDGAKQKRGEGVKIAVLDTGIAKSSQSLSNASITTFDLFGLEGDGAGHGTMVASLIAGDGDVTGVAPSASILSFPVLDADGSGDVFSLAEAIVAAADAGADIISMSLGFSYESAVLRTAVEYAQSKGCLLVASAGNEGVATDGSSTVCYPAAFDGVFAVGAVNADGQRAGFSSTGGVHFTAPGVGVLADDGESPVLFSGTSAAAPLAAASIAYVMQAKDETTAHEAVLQLVQNANEIGMPGFDEEYGFGNLNVERALMEDGADIIDAAAADVVLRQEDDVQSVYFTIQNRGGKSIGEAEMLCTLLLENGTTIIRKNIVNDIEKGATAVVSFEVPSEASPVSADLSVKTSSEDSQVGNNVITRRFK